MKHKEKKRMIETLIFVFVFCFLIIAILVTKPHTGFVVKDLNINTKTSLGYFIDFEEHDNYKIGEVKLTGYKIGNSKIYLEVNNKRYLIVGNEIEGNFNDYCKETCNIAENASSGIIIIEITDGSVYLEKLSYNYVNGSIDKQVSEETGINISTIENKTEENLEGIKETIIDVQEIKNSNLATMAGECFTPTGSNNLLVNDTVICKNTYYIGGDSVFIISKSGIDLDCNGSKFIGTNNTYFLTIYLNQTSTIENITVRNCDAENYQLGILYISRYVAQLTSRGWNISYNNFTNMNYGLYAEEGFMYGYFSHNQFKNMSKYAVMATYPYWADNKVYDFYFDTTNTNNGEPMYLFRHINNGEITGLNLKQNSFWGGQVILYNVTNSWIHDNNLSNSSGFGLYNSHNNNFTKNIISNVRYNGFDDSVGDYGFVFDWDKFRNDNEYSFDNYIDTSNLVNGYPVHHYYNVDNIVVENQNLGDLRTTSVGIYTFYNVNNITIRNNKVSNSSGFVFMFNTNNSKIYNNTIQNVSSGYSGFAYYLNNVSNIDFYGNLLNNSNLIVQRHLTSDKQKNMVMRDNVFLDSRDTIYYIENLSIFNNYFGGNLLNQDISLSVTPFYNTYIYKNVFENRVYNLRIYDYLDKNKNLTIYNNSFLRIRNKPLSSYNGEGIFVGGGPSRGIVIDSNFFNMSERGSYAVFSQVTGYNYILRNNKIIAKNYSNGFSFNGRLLDSLIFNNTISGYGGIGGEMQNCSIINNSLSGFRSIDIRGRNNLYEGNYINTSANLALIAGINSTIRNNNIIYRGPTRVLIVGEDFNFPSVLSKNKIYNNRIEIIYFIERAIELRYNHTYDIYNNSIKGSYNNVLFWYNSYHPEVTFENNKISSNGDKLFNITYSGKNITIKNNKFSLRNIGNNGIYVFNRTRDPLTIYNNTFNYSSYSSRGSAIFLKNSKANVRDNLIFNSVTGIRLSGSKDIELVNNDIHNTIGYNTGININNSRNITIKYSNISSNAGNGIYLYNATANILNNTINSNMQNGILNTNLKLNETGTIILDNTICYNAQYGIKSINASLKTNESEIIARNNFCGNNTYGNLIQYWYAQIRTLFPNNDVFPNVGVLIEGSDESHYSTITNASGLSEVILLTSYYLTNAVHSLNYFITGNKYEYPYQYYGELNITINQSKVGQDAINLTLYPEYCNCNSFGMWYVNTTCVLIDRYCERYGDLLITEYGNLTLINTTIEFKDYSYRLIVESNGRLQVRDKDNNPDTTNDRSVITSLGAILGECVEEYIPYCSGGCDYTGVPNENCEAGCSMGACCGLREMGIYPPLPPPRPCNKWFCLNATPCSVYGYEGACNSQENCMWKQIGWMGSTIYFQNNSKISIINSLINVTGNDLFGGFDVETDNFIFEGNTFSNSYGLNILASDVRLKNNKILDNYNGLSIKGNNIVIDGNTISNTKHAGSGIDIISANNIDIINNYLNNNTGYGIYAENSSDIFIFNNIISKTMNTTSSLGAGIYFNSSINATIKNNTIQNNNIGVAFDNASTNNYVYYNRFMNNNLQAQDYGTNNWNITKNTSASPPEWPTGNYWRDIITSDLDIRDNNSDGWGDSGDDYPYSAAKGGNVLGNVVDYGPKPVRNPGGGNGGESGYCGDFICSGGENCYNCPQDCGECPELCGNGKCDMYESCVLCPQDCGKCPETTAKCGDKRCLENENCENCPIDCGECKIIEEKEVKKEPEKEIPKVVAPEIVEIKYKKAANIMGFILLAIAVLMIILMPYVVGPKSFIDLNALQKLQNNNLLEKIRKIRSVENPYNIKKLRVERLEENKLKKAKDISKEYNIPIETVETLMIANKHYRPRVYTTEKIPEEVKSLFPNIGVYKIVGKDGKIVWDRGHIIKHRKVTKEVKREEVKKEQSKKEEKILEKKKTEIDIEKDKEIREINKLLEQMKKL